MSTTAVRKVALIKIMLFNRGTRSNDVALLIAGVVREAGRTIVTHNGDFEYVDGLVAEADE